MLNIEDIEYLENMSNLKVNEELKKKIEKHMKRFNLYNGICAYYYDWNDFCTDWCDDIGYTRTEAKKLLHGGIGEFQIIKDLGIIRYTI